MKIDTLKNIIILILIVIIGYLFYNQSEEVIEPEEVITEADLVGVIPITEARALQNYFIRTRASLFTDSLKYDDARSFTISLDKMENYVKFVRHAGSEYPNLGLRFYLGAKKNVDDLSEGLSTMFIVATSTPDETQKATIFGAAAPPPPPENLPLPIQNEMGDDHPPIDL